MDLYDGHGNITELSKDVNQLKDDIADVTNGICRFSHEYNAVATKGSQEPYVFKFYGKAGETYTFQNSGIKVNIILVHTDNTRTTIEGVGTNCSTDITLTKDCKTFGYYPYMDGNVNISVYGKNYRKIVSDMLSNTVPKISNNANSIKAMLNKYGYRAMQKEDEYEKENNYKLVSGGVCAYDNKYELRKYSVSSCQLVYVKSNEVYQWQKDKSVPTMNNENLIGEPVSGNVDSLVVVPDGAKYLIISALKTGDNSGKYAFEPFSYAFNMSKYYKDNVFISNYERRWFDGSDCAYDDFDEDTTVEQFYAKMNALVDQYTYRMQKHNLGKDASGEYDIWGYIYKPYDMPYPSAERPRIIITSCHHGFERGSAFGLYYLMWLFKNKLSDPCIRELANCVEIAFIPIINPWGWEQYTPVNTDAETVGRTNSNGVDLNRGYNGESLQPEQIIVKNFVEQNKENAILFIDHHVNGGTRHTDNTNPNSGVGQRVWLSSDGYECGELVKKINSAFVNYFSCYGGGLYGGAEGALLATQTHGNNASPGYSTYVGDSNGIISFTFEGIFKKSSMKAEIESEKEFNPAVNKLNTVALVNLLNHCIVSLKDKFM